jgi:hypothetical protein
MDNKLNKEIAAIILQSPLSYPEHQYHSPQRRFRVILDKMDAWGVTAIIVPVFQRKEGNKRIYRYMVRIGFKTIKTYSRPHSAKLRIFREYQNLKKQQNGKENQKGTDAH